MEISPWTIYWITRLDSIQFFFQIGLFLFSSGVFFFFFMLLTEVTSQFSQPDKKMIASLSKWIKRCILGCGVFGVLLTITPSTKEAIAITVIPEVVNSETVQEIPGKLLDLIDANIDDMKREE